MERGRRHRCFRSSREPAQAVIAGRDPVARRSGTARPVPPRGSPRAVGCDGARCVELLGKAFAPEDREAVDRRRAEQWQFAVDKAEAAADRNIGIHAGDRRRYEVDLLGEPVDELGLVAAGDLQRRPTEQRLADPHFALVALGVDDPHSSCRDGDVVVFAREPGMRRSCNTATSGHRLVSDCSTSSSPPAPSAQERSCCGASRNARITAPRRG